MPSHDNTELVEPSMLPKDSLTVIELFQSQGCSSCPPANDNLLKLVGRQDMLILTYDVTYWDHLGWRDTFGNAAFEGRQRDYAKALGYSNIFTPQIELRLLGVYNTLTVCRLLSMGGLMESGALLKIFNP